MNKEAQKHMNGLCIVALWNAQDEFETGNYTYKGRLRSCKAKVYETDSFYILQSYKTNFVAIIDKKTNQCYDLLRYVYGYTRISARHISKFWHDYGDNRIYRYTYREV